MVSLLVKAVVCPRLVACGTTVIVPVTASAEIDATILVGFVASQPKALLPLRVAVRFML